VIAVYLRRRNPDGSRQKDDAGAHDDEVNPIHTWQWMDRLSFPLAQWNRFNLSTF
jgi:hypothetical protein